MFRPTLVKNYFSADLIQFLNLVVEQVKRNPNVDFEENEFYRKQVHNMPMLVDIHHQMILPRLKEFLFSHAEFDKDIPVEELAKLSDGIKPSYNFLSMYFKGKGRCPKHTDRPQCKYTVDICLNQKKPWGLTVMGQEYFLEPGDALIYSGTDHEHWRETQLQDDNFCDLVFFHFVDKDFDGGLN